MNERNEKALHNTQEKSFAFSPQKIKKKHTHKA